MSTTEEIVTATLDAPTAADTAARTRRGAELSEAAQDILTQLRERDKADRDIAANEAERVADNVRFKALDGKGWDASVEELGEMNTLRSKLQSDAIVCGALVAGRKMVTDRLMKLSGLHPDFYRRLEEQHRTPATDKPVPTPTAGKVSRAK